MPSSVEYNRKWREENRDKYREWCRKNYEANREKKLARNRRWREQNQPKVKALRRKYVFGEGSPEHFKEQIKNQQGLCAVCGDSFIEEKTPHQDHDHSTGQLRGVLCGRCNPALGGFRDSPELLRRAADYVEFWRGREA